MKGKWPKKRKLEKLWPNIDMNQVRNNFEFQLYILEFPQKFLAQFALNAFDRKSRCV